MSPREIAHDAAGWGGGVATFVAAQLLTRTLREAIRDNADRSDVARRIDASSARLAEGSVAVLA